MAETAILAVDLPPRVRGALVERVARVEEVRLTPACAGSTRIASQNERQSSTYPRVCGEHSYTSTNWHNVDDLPPRVRGARLRDAVLMADDRLTPACAGSTSGQRHGTGNVTTYPRVCGEHHTAVLAVTSGHDLPPRVRGARRINKRWRNAAGLTPACAGSTSRRRRGAARAPTYPRVCGEHPRSSPLSGSDIDLPPRVRGARARAGGWGLGMRLTPACAGSTPPAARSAAGRSTYPRVCGEHSCLPDGRVTRIDLPPRVRGAPQPGLLGHLAGRLTPACAGST